MHRILNYLIVCVLLTGTLFSASAAGIIIGNDSIVQAIFQKYSKNQIIEFTEEISKTYSGAIVHLGRKFPFDKGGFFYSEKSQENLALFSSELEKKSVKLYLWFLDSYGSRQFAGLYNEHKEIIDNLYRGLDKLKIKFDGLIIDMEWINRPFGNNNSKYLEILSYMRSQFVSKEIMVFASLVDDPKENSRRGFDETGILDFADNIIPMLYISDGGFKTDYGFIRPLLQDRRINQLKGYYAEKGYIPAYSVENIYLFKRWWKVVFIPSLFYQNVIQFNDLKHKHTNNKYYYSIDRFRLLKEYEIEYKGKKIQLRKGKSIFFLKNTPALIEEPCFIWEYFYTQKS